ncbi:MAG: hypothetical protein LBD32_00060, partial [Cytophagales bacterium]|nr:hypothetical protein [Cytophagales bacterium]
MNQRIFYLLAGGLTLCACNEPEGNSEEDDNKFPLKPLVKTSKESQSTEVENPEIPEKDPVITELNVEIVNEEELRNKGLLARERQIENYFNIAAKIGTFELRCTDQNGEDITNFGK